MKRALVAGTGMLLLSASVGAALAQTGGGGAEQKLDKSASEADVETEDMSIDEMVRSAEQKIETMKTQLDKSFKLLEESVQSEDVAAQNTRNEAVTAMKGLVKLSEDNLLTMKQKASQGDRAQVEQQYVKVSIASAKVSELYARVRTAGGVELDVDEVDVQRDVEIDSDLPQQSAEAGGRPRGGPLGGPAESGTFSQAGAAEPDHPVHASAYF